MLSLRFGLFRSTERSAALYERLGFVHLGELRVPDGPRFWPMRRPPAAA